MEDATSEAITTFVVSVTAGILGFLVFGPILAIPILLFGIVVWRVLSAPFFRQRERIRALEGRVDDLESEL